jgi:hypothetical protein
MECVMDCVMECVMECVMDGDVCVRVLLAAARTTSWACG